ncbi:hypothetical protein CDAR_366611 [Caerostris darwini]|uniref:Uncharacterized protein n=1 Tax=Caerostris darwini TaxID=1538125 RepID=A0AAV4Q6Z2_9ARAC|nr:hypothetical protein CDAR_366611 [Caerostris darwini]
MSLEAEIRLKPSKYLRNPMFNNNRLQRMSSDYVEESRPSRRLSPCVIFRSPPPNLTPHCRYRSIIPTLELLQPPCKCQD